jgi:2,5-diketo-D-gluconate reductase B
MTVSAIPKSTSPQHIASNVAALDLDVDDDELRRIDGLDRGLRLIDPPFTAWWRTVRRGTPRPP